jgi:murein DD-endopeptidase MepM/ murein hydrolase activator NlpD
MADPFTILARMASRRQLRPGRAIFGVGIVLGLSWGLFDTSATSAISVSEAVAAKAAKASVEAPAQQVLHETVAPVKMATLVPAWEDITDTDRIRRGETLSVALTRHGVKGDEIHQLVASLKGVLDMRGIRPGDVFALTRKTSTSGERDPALYQFEFRQRSLRGVPTVIKAKRLQVKAAASASEGESGSPAPVRFVAHKHETPVITRVESVGGTVVSSLYEALLQGGEGPDLVNKFADVFSWDIDFYREVQRGDSFKVIVEKQFAEDRFIGYGKVLAAEYINAGKVHRGFMFASKDGKHKGLYDEKGGSLEKDFLKNPLELARITSRFGQRFHPVLKRRKQHNGVDYGAPRGTPFWSVADGVVVDARYSRTAGNMVRIQHKNGLITEYFHATRFAKGIRKGKRVEQRQIIGYVGSTGRSTGPHLHYGMVKRGRHVNPSRQKFGSASPIPQSHLAEYLKTIAPLVAELDALEIS